MSDVSLEFGELYGAFSDALSSFKKLPTDGNLKDVDFYIKPPEDGQFRWYAVIDNQKFLLCEICHCYLPFESIRDWMERSMVFDRSGHLKSELLTLDSRSYTVTISLYHLGWDKAELLRSGYHRKIPFSHLVVMRDDRTEPVVNCLCPTNRTILGMYLSLMDGLLRYRDRFENPRLWPTSRSYKIRYGESYAYIYRDQLRSKVVEKLLP